MALLRFDFGTFLAAGGTSLLLVDIIEEWLGLPLGHVAALLTFLASHEDDIEADFLHRYPSIDLLDLGTERLSWRRFENLIAHLPRDSATVLNVAGEQARWGDQEHLLATVVDAISQLSWITASAYSRKAPDRPKPLRRPGMPEPGRMGNVSYSKERVRQILATMTPRAVSDAGH